jgi:eukaryotic-like serine/threonine-protein kinase
VGASLYYMLTAKYTVDFPVPGEQSSSATVKHPLQIILEEPPLPVKLRRFDIPDSLAVVVDKAVKKDVTARYQSAAEFREALLSAARREGWLELK